jgi:hypothetical protein
MFSPSLIQVAADLRDPRVRAREVRGLIKAGHELRCDDLPLLSSDERGGGTSRRRHEGQSRESEAEPHESKELMILSCVTHGQ